MVKIKDLTEKVVFKPGDIVEYCNPHQSIYFGKGSIGKIIRKHKILDDFHIVEFFNIKGKEGIVTHPKGEVTWPVNNSHLKLINSSPGEIYYF